MSTIIAGHFQLQDQAARAVEVLVEAGFERATISSFFVNPAGQHDTFPLGGDRDKSPGAENTDAGVAAGVSAGAVAGAAVGAAAIPVAGPAGPALGGLVGGHVGGLVGTLGATRDDAGRGRRAAGMLVAVATENDGEQRQAVDLLRRLHAGDIEQGEGHIRNGDWHDFDPLQAPVLIAA